MKAGNKDVNQEMHEVILDPRKCWEYMRQKGGDSQERAGVRDPVVTALM